MDSAPAFRVALAVSDEMNYGERLRAWLAALREEFPGWVIWDVRLYPIGARWCARPMGCQDGTRTVYADTAEGLAGVIGEVITGDPR